MRDEMDDDDIEETQGGSSQIFCLRWVKRDAAKVKPDKIQLSKEELKKAIEEGSSALKQDPDESDSDSADENDVSQNENHEEDDFDDLKEFDLDHYDDDEDDGNEPGLSSLVVFASNDDDPYLIKDKDASDESENELAETEALNLKKGDNLLVCGRCERDCSLLEIHVYNRDTHDFYVHHDIPLSSTPLCMEWMDFDAGAESENSNRGNFVGIGNINSLIEVWDLDVLNTIEPAFTLGVKLRKQRKMDSPAPCHTDAVMDLAWNPLSRHGLASSSADRTVALWDLRSGRQSRVFRDHREKVQSVEWRPGDVTCLLSGACDGRIISLDTRSKAKSGLKWKMEGEIERLAWNPQRPSYFAASNDGGKIYYCDVRKPRTPLYDWQAHEMAVPSLTISSGLLYSASSDGMLKAWKLEEGNCAPLMEKDLKMGMVHCFHSNPDVRGMLAIGGEKGGVRLWNAHSNDERINKHFHMMCIHRKFCESLGQSVSSDQLWEHLGTMYNLKALDESEVTPFKNTRSEFKLPPEILNCKKAQSTPSTEDNAAEDEGPAAKPATKSNRKRSRQPASNTANPSSPAVPTVKRRRQ